MNGVVLKYVLLKYIEHKETKQKTGESRPKSSSTNSAGCLEKNYKL